MAPPLTTLLSGFLFLHVDTSFRVTYQRPRVSSHYGLIHTPCSISFDNHRSCRILLSDPSVAALRWLHSATPLLKGAFVYLRLVAASMMLRILLGVASSSLTYPFSSYLNSVQILVQWVKTRPGASRFTKSLTLRRGTFPASARGRRSAVKSLVHCVARRDNAWGNLCP